MSGDVRVDGGARHMPGGSRHGRIGLAFVVNERGDITLDGVLHEHPRTTFS